ncbi:MAG TPA: hypothetical protein VKB38_12700 [Terracidiphilus sp.]|nr:hypothetical protein [Terracidiphilus sp.]
MKRFLLCAAMLALVSASAFAAKNSDKITIGRTVTVGTTQLPAADYKVTWSGTGSDAQVTLTHGKSVVTLPAKVTEHKNNVNSLVLVDKDGSTSLIGMDLGNVTVEFTPSPSSGQ